MSQRRPLLKIVVSNKNVLSHSCLRQKKLPLGFLTLPASSPTLNSRIERLRAVSPGHVAVIERLVNTVLGRLDGTG